MHNESENSLIGFIFSYYEVNLEFSPIERLEKVILPYFRDYKKYELTEVVIRS